MSNSAQSDPNSRGVVGEFTSRAPYWAAGGGALAILANAFRMRSQNLAEVSRAQAVDDRDTIRLVIPGSRDEGEDIEAKKAIEESLQRIIDINTREPGEDKTASTKKVEKALDESDIPGDVYFYTDGKDRATVCLGDWHEDDVRDKALAFGREHWKNWEDPDCTEIGMPEWASKSISSNNSADDEEDKTASDTPVSLDLPTAGTTKAKEIAEGTGRGLRTLGSTVWDKTGGKALEAIGDAFSGFAENITPDARTFLAVPAMIAGTAGAGYLGYRGVDRLIRKKEERDLKKRYENIRRQYARSIGEDIELALQEKSAADIEFDSPTHVPILRGMVSRISEELQDQDLACDDKVANFTAGQIVMGGMVTAALATLMAGHMATLKQRRRHDRLYVQDSIPNPLRNVRFEFDSGEKEDPEVPGAEPTQKVASAFWGMSILGSRILESAKPERDTEIKERLRQHEEEVARQIKERSEIAPVERRDENTMVVNTRFGPVVIDTADPEMAAFLEDEDNVNVLASSMNRISA